MKRIEIAHKDIIVDCEDIKQFRVTAQTHRGRNFGVSGSAVFMASNGIALGSNVCPEIYGDRVWLQGWRKNRDDYELLVKPELFERIVFAINEYNLFDWERAKDKMPRKITYSAQDSRCDDGSVVTLLMLMEQTHRLSSFTQDNGYVFNACNGITLISDDYPRLEGSVLHVRGSQKQRDNEYVTINAPIYERVKDAIEEYNESNGLSGFATIDEDELTNDKHDSFTNNSQELDELILKTSQAMAKRVESFESENASRLSKEIGVSVSEANILLKNEPTVLEHCRTVVITYISRLLNELNERLSK